MAQCANVFVYGTLLAEEVLHALIKRVPSSKAALITDYRRFSVQDRLYPAAIHMKGDKLQGKASSIPAKICSSFLLPRQVLLDLTDEELQILDNFEGDEYTKLIVEPLLATDNGFEQESSVKAFMYVWSDPEDSDLFGSWDYEKWRIHELEKYTEMCEDYMSTGAPPP